jgi:hypothetical protein
LAAKAHSAAALPIITISNVERLVEAGYRERCADRLTEIVVYLNDYLGTGRLFIP